MDINDMFPEQERPLARLIDGGGFTGILRHIAVIGDSLSSGEFEGTSDSGEKIYHDMFDYSWGQFLARMCGNTVYNFSRGGMTAREYMKGWAKDMGYLDPALACEAYIVALGVNDVSACLKGEMTFGELSDIECDADSFVGYYTAILRAYRDIRPDAYLFLMTMPREHTAPEREPLRDKHRELLFRLARTLPRTYVLDFRTFAPVYDASFKEKFYLGGHLNPMGYQLTARMVASYVDFIIRHNMDDFKQAGFIGTPFKNAEHTRY